MMSAEQAPTPAPAAAHPPFLFLAVVAATTAALDLGSKHWASRKLGVPDAPGLIKIIDGHLNFVLSHNKGGANGFLGSTPDAFRVPFFLLVSTCAIGAMIALYRKISPDQRAMQWGLPLILGGALGNLTDRLRIGSVVDFIQVYATIGGQPRYWPTFNIADIAISAGVALLGIDLIQQTRLQWRAASQTP